MYRGGCISPYAVWMRVSKERNLYTVLPCPPHSKQSKAVGFMGRIWETDPKMYRRSRRISEISEGAERAHSPENLIRLLFASLDVEMPRLTPCWFDSCVICASPFGQRSGAGRSMAPGPSELWGALVWGLRGLAWPGGLCEHPQERPRQETSSGCRAQGLFYRGAVVATSPGQEGGLRSEPGGLFQALFLPCYCKKLLAEWFCFTRRRVFKGTWKWGKRNGSAQQQNLWALPSKLQPIKRYEAFPCGEGTPCSHSVSPLPQPEFVTKSPLSPVRAGNSPVMQRGGLIPRQKQLGRRRRGRSLLSAIWEGNVWNMHDMHLYGSNLKALHWIACICS